jgi:endonuclease YncB( thermonuclease family)
LLLAGPPRGLWGQEASVPIEGIPFEAASLDEASPSVLVTEPGAPDLAVGIFDLLPGPQSIVDGDTIRVAGQKQSLRLIGLDAEETFKTSARDRALRTLAERDWPEYLKTVYAGSDPDHPPKFATPLGEAAKEFAVRFFGDSGPVRLELDDRSRVEDYYGRRLVHVLVKRAGRWVNFNVEVVRQGLSPYFVKYGRSARWHDRFLAAEAEARRNSRGIWAKNPKVPCYPDYATRLAWWQQRDTAGLRIAARRNAGEEIIVLGEHQAWERLMERTGKPATVAGTPGRLERRGETGLLPIAHRQGLDLMIAGPYDDVEKLNLSSEEGGILLIHGTVSRHDGRPQFRVETVTVERLALK